MTPLRLRMLQDMRIRNLTQNTQRSYLEQVSRFARHFGRSPEELGPEEVRVYQISLDRRLWIHHVRNGLGIHGANPRVRMAITGCGPSADRDPWLIPIDAEHVKDSLAGLWNAGDVDLATRVRDVEDV